MSSAAEILAKSKVLRELTTPKRGVGSKPSKSKGRQEVSEYMEEYNHTSIYLPMHYRVFQVLALVGFEWSDVIVNSYLDNPVLESDFPGNTIVIHGHPRSQITCRFQDQCHVLGYRPVGNEHPNFLKRWEKFGYES